MLSHNVMTHSRLLVT